jgi:hypothetical protein
MRVRLSHHIVQLEEHGSGKQALGQLIGRASEGDKIHRPGCLIFHRYGNRYFLREGWEGDSCIGVVSVPSQAEKKMLGHKQAGTQTQLAFNANPAW